MRQLEGGCQVPIGVNTTLDGDQLTLTGIVASDELFRSAAEWLRLASTVVIMGFGNSKPVLAATSHLHEFAQYFTNLRIGEKTLI